jgi:hypothetical protein
MSVAIFLCLACLDRPVFCANPGTGCENVGVYPVGSEFTININMNDPRTKFDDFYGTAGFGFTPNPNYECFYNFKTDAKEYDQIEEWLFKMLLDVNGFQELSAKAQKVGNSNQVVVNDFITKYLRSGRTLTLKVRITRFLSGEGHTNIYYYQVNILGVNIQDIKSYVLASLERSKVLERIEEEKTQAKIQQAAIEKHHQADALKMRAKKWVSQGVPENLLMANFVLYTERRYSELFNQTYDSRVEFKVLEFLEKLKGDRLFVKSANMWVLHQKWTDEMTNGRREFRYGFTGSGRTFSLSRIIIDGYELPVGSRQAYNEVMNAMTNR